MQSFSEKYAVDQDLGVKYMHHIAYLNMMKQKRERGRREKAERESNLTYEDLLRKQRVSVYRTSQSDNRKEINENQD